MERLEIEHYQTTSRKIIKYRRTSNYYIIMSHMIWQFTPKGLFRAEHITTCFCRGVKIDTRSLQRRSTNDTFPVGRRSSLGGWIALISSPFVVNMNRFRVESCANGRAYARWKKWHIQSDKRARIVRDVEQFRREIAPTLRRRSFFIYFYIFLCARLDDVFILFEFNYPMKNDTVRPLGRTTGKITVVTWKAYLLCGECLYNYIWKFYDNVIENNMFYWTKTLKLYYNLTWYNI